MIEVFLNQTANILFGVAGAVDVERAKSLSLFFCFSLFCSLVRYENLLEVVDKCF